MEGDSRQRLTAGRGEGGSGRRGEGGRGRRGGGAMMAMMGRCGGIGRGRGV